MTPTPQDSAERRQGSGQQKQNGLSNDHLQTHEQDQKKESLSNFNVSHVFTQDYLEFINSQLETQTPQQILAWALISLPNMVQTTAFGLTGLAIIDMLSSITTPAGDSSDKKYPTSVPLVFIDTLYHFPETLALKESIEKNYSAPIHVFKPQNADTAQDFEQLHGTKLWETNPDVYGKLQEESKKSSCKTKHFPSTDYLVKVEPQHRITTTFQANVLITGRRRSQGASRASLPILALDASTSTLKLNPLAAWSFAQVREYIDDNGVPVNALLEKGYTSVGDWHSTLPSMSTGSVAIAGGSGSGENVDERAGRWSGSGKTECGLHKDYFKMRSAYLSAMNKKKKILNDLGTGNVEVDDAHANPSSIRV
jgi:phosphoadenosine phosphosulfate reductase